MEEYQYLDKQIEDEKYASVLNLPVEVPVSEIEEALNQQIKGLIYEDNSYDNDEQDNLKAKVWILDRIRVVAKDETFLFEVPIKVWASAGYNISPLGIKLSGYKDTEFSLKIRFISKIGVTPTWQIKADTYVDSYDWISEPNVKVGSFKIPIKAMVSRLLNRNFDKISKTIDAQIAEAIPLKNHVEQAWGMAKAPVLLSKEFDTWLMVQPAQVSMTPLLVKNNVLRSTIGLKAFTQTITSAVKPTPLAGKILPPLTIAERVPDHFRLGLISIVSYKEASRIAQANFAGKTFSFLKGQYNVQVVGIELYGQNDKLVIKANLKGSINGHIYLKGIPYYNPDTKILSLKDLDYDLDTKNTLIKTANWMFQGKFAAMMEKSMFFPVGEQIAGAQSSIQKMLDDYEVKKGIHIKGKLKSIVPDKVYLTPDHIYSVVFAEGKVALQVEGLQGL